MDQRAVPVLHTQDDLLRASKAVRRMLALFGMLLLVAAFLIVGSLIWRDNTHLNNPREVPSQIFSICVTVVIGAVIIFFWSMKVTPWLAYRRFLRELYGGLTHDLRGIVTGVEDETTHRDGLDFYAILVNVGDLQEAEDDRLVYWDAQLGKPSIMEGDEVYVRTHGKDMVGYELLRRQDGSDDVI